MTGSQTDNSRAITPSPTKHLTETAPEGVVAISVGVVAILVGVVGVPVLGSSQKPG